MFCLLENVGFYKCASNKRNNDEKDENKERKCPTCFYSPTLIRTTSLGILFLDPVVCVFGA